jgi:hypothetical protein
MAEVSATQPLATRPHMPGYGIPEAAEGLLSWQWAVERLRLARHYWLSTTRPDGRPHTMPVWGVWVEDCFHFSTGAASRKARNLTSNAHCVVSVEAADGAIIVEGTAAEVKPETLARAVFAAYQAKYEGELDPALGPIFAVPPRVVFGFSSVPGEFAGSATRWTFI